MTAEQKNTLNSVLAELQLPAAAVDKVLHHMTLDSRKVVGGELFIAVPGVHGDGRQYIDQALANGAAAVLVDDSGGFDLAGVGSNQASVFIVPQLCKKMGLLADRFYRHPSAHLKVFGVTGTNGKTSCCWFMAELLKQQETPCALMGTVGQGMPGQLQSSLNTTGDVISLHRYLAQLVAEGIPALAMEVSSHGLDQGRVDGVRFEAALFTHISRDHLDYHGSLENYAAAKARLFSRGNFRHGVIGKDDAFAPLMMAACGDNKPITWSLEDTSADVYLSNIQVLSKGFRATLHTPWGGGILNTALLGRFNLENLLSVIAVLGVHGYSIENVLSCVPAIASPPGRMQPFGGGEQPQVLVDYAHTPDAIESVLSSLREHTGGAGKIICVYGCGGDRDRGKRPLMTKAALSGADSAVLTSDNPRNEDPQQIFADALEGHSDARLRLIADRREAIHRAIHSAQADDIVVIVGKGHENYQEVCGERHHFDDAEQVRAALCSRGVPA